MSPLTYGSSAPGQPELIPAMLATYTPAQAAAVPAGMRQWLSASSAMTDGAGTYPAGPWGRADLRGDNGVTAQNNAVAFLVSYFRNNLRDDADHLGVHDHEPDNNGAIYTAAQYNAELIIVMTRVKPAVNVSRGHPVLFGSCMTGQLFASSTAILDGWMGGTGIDIVGSDPYANLALITDTANYAAHLGVPWGLREFGTQANGNGNSTDAQHLSHMQSLISINNARGNPGNPLLWFDSGQNSLDTKLTAATLAGATTVNVARMPGGGPSDSSTFPAGSTIIIDPHGTHPETVSTTTTLNYTAQPAQTLHVPALAFAHANNAVVWLYPQAIAYWRTPPPSPGGGGSFTQSVSTAVTTAGIQKARAIKATILGHAPNSPAYLTAASSGFEDGSVGDWYTTGAPAPVIANTTVHAHTGIRAMQITWPTQAGSGLLVDQVQLNFTANAGDVINVSAWVWVPVGVPPVQLVVAGIPGFSPPSNVTGQWQQLLYTFTALGGVQTVALFATGSTTSGQLTYLDDVTITRSAVRDLGQRITATKQLLLNPVESVRAAAAAGRQVLEPLVARTLIGRFLQVTVAQAPARALRAGVASTSPVTQTAAAVAARAVAVSSRATKTVAAGIGSLIVTQSKVTAVQTLAARTVAKVGATTRALQAPARAVRAGAGSIGKATATQTGSLRAAVTASRGVVEAAALSITEAFVSLVINVTATETTAAALTNNVAAARRTTVTVGRTVARQTTATVGAFLAMFNRLSPGIASSTSTATISIQNGTYTVTSPGIDGPYAFAGTSNGVIDGLRLTAPTNATKPPAVPGERWYGRALVANTSAAAQQVNVYVEFLTSGFVYISSHLVGFAVIKAGQTALIAGPAVTVAPPTAAFAHLLVIAPNSPNGYTQLVADLVLVGPNAGLAANVTVSSRLPVAPVTRAVAAISAVLPAAVTHPVGWLAQAIRQRFLAAVIRGVPSLLQSQGRGNPTPPNFDARA